MIKYIELNQIDKEILKDYSYKRLIDFNKKELRLYKKIFTGCKLKEYLIYDKDITKPIKIMITVVWDNVEYIITHPYRDGTVRLELLTTFNTYPLFYLNEDAPEPFGILSKDELKVKMNEWVKFFDAIDEYKEKQLKILDEVYQKDMEQIEPIKHLIEWENEEKTIGKVVQNGIILHLKIDKNSLFNLKGNVVRDSTITFDIHTIDTIDSTIDNFLKLADNKFSNK